MTMPQIMVREAMMAGPPTFISFLKLNSKPKAKRRKTTPMSAQILMFPESTIVGAQGKWGPARMPATM